MWFAYGKPVGKIGSPEVWVKFEREEHQKLNAGSVMFTSGNKHTCKLNPLSVLSPSMSNFSGFNCVATLTRREGTQIC